ncbi:NAD-dependent epimerase/dehydratase family protein [Flavobacterium sp. CBA20B-1]|uniref:NAD-dependent epimerase/dehydratase family protein n=1 Tax=unclassified Flavobacterium TaxID=196869 RepID=UPI00222565CA|nr:MULTISPECIES: NAD-dependent epimerase/dehydratase family protein [unclassified Flavobacterium]WCM42253.1 NAD-dependent epimerase/dehydratase family protein [Flavobacterium sp. CBA20B-1]
MKTIITGSSGFVGKNLTAYLNKQDIEVQDLSLRATDWKNHINKHVTAIIHLAGKAHDTANTSSADEYFKVNRDLTIELFKEFLKSDSKDFFFFSSVKAVADTVEGVLYEDIMPKAVTPYGQSKLEAETYLLNQKLPASKRLFIIRPCMIHGPGNKGNLNLLYKVVHKGIPWPLAAFENQRSFLSIDNLSFLVLTMLQNKEVESGIYNFADDEAISTNQLIKIIGKASGRKTNLWNISGNFIKGVAQIGDKLKLPLNSERLKKLTESYVVSNKKIKTALNIYKLPLSAEDGLVKTIQSFKK